MSRRALPECKRCCQLGVTCEGYGLRLSWVQYNPEDEADGDLEHSMRERSSPPEARASRRLLASFDAFPPLERMLSPELDATLTNLDAWRPDLCSEIEDGAFCVFAVQPPMPHHCSRRNRDLSVYEGRLTFLGSLTAVLSASIAAPDVSAPASSPLPPQGEAIEALEASGKSCST